MERYVKNLFKEDENLIRIESEQKEDGFLHCLLYAYSSKYAIMDDKKQSEYISKVKKSIFGPKKKNLNNAFDRLFIKCLNDLYDWQDNIDELTEAKIGRKLMRTKFGRDLLKRTVKDKEVCSFLTDLIPYQNICKIFDQSRSICDKVDPLAENFSSAVMYELDKKCPNLNYNENEKFKRCMDYISDILCELIDYVSTKTFPPNDTFRIDQKNIDTISNYFKRNILILGSKLQSRFKDRKTIILIHVNGSYDLLARETDDIEYEFNHNDKLVSKVRSLIKKYSSGYGKYVRKYISRSPERDRRNKKRRDNQTNLDSILDYQIKKPSDTIRKLKKKRLYI